MTNAAKKVVESELESETIKADVTPITKADVAPPQKKGVSKKTAKATKQAKQVNAESIPSAKKGKDKAEIPPVVKADVKSTPAQKSAPKKSRNQSRKRPSRQEIIERQANPTTIFAGKQKTLNLSFTYGSDILHEYLQMNQSTMLSAYERIAGLMRMVSNDKTAYRHVSTWINHNVQICQEQIKELQAQREAIVEDLGVEDMKISINVPEIYHTTFEASHPIAHKMLAILLLVDNELNQSEELFLGGLIDDEAYGKLRNQATTIVRGSVDRIFKATTPGIRNNGRYSPQELAAWIRQGNQLMFADLPQRFEHIVNGD